MEFEDDYESDEEEVPPEPDEDEVWYSEFVRTKREREARKAKFVKEFKMAPGATHRDAGTVTYDPSRNSSIVYTHEEWMLDNMPHLHTLYEMTQNYVRNEGIFMLDRCRFPDFVGFASRHTTLRYNPYT